MRSLFVGISFFLFFFSAKATASADLFEQANEAYLVGDFEQSIALYQDIESQGFSSYNLHFNAGNAYFEQGDWANAILQYERALKFSPNDKKTIHNLSLAIANTEDALFYPPYNPLQSIWLGIAAKASSSIWAKMAILYLVLTCVLTIFFFFSRKRLFSIVAIVLAFGFVFTFFLAKSKYQIEENKSYRILFAKEISVKEAPSLEAKEVLILHEGTKAKITNEVDDWIEITLPNQEKGWAEKKDWVII